MATATRERSKPGRLETTTQVRIKNDLHAAVRYAAAIRGQEMIEVLDSILRASLGAELADLDAKRAALDSAV